MTIGPNNFSGIRGMGMSVGVKIPKPILDAAKILPQIKAEAPAYAKALQTEAANVRTEVGTATVVLETGVVAVIFGGIIAALLLREGKK